MTLRTCSVDGCEKAVFARGLCQTHYARKRRTGSTELAERVRDDLGRLMRRVDVTSTCWLWQGPLDGRGYGAFWLNGRLDKAHRAAFILLSGPIPKGMDLDHLCRVTRCVNPLHLEPVTHAENVRRGLWGAHVEALRSRTHCKHGHEFTPENTSINGGARVCKTCARIRNAAYRERKKVGVRVVPKPVGSGRPCTTWALT